MTMISIGIALNQHDLSIAAVIDGKILYAKEIERISRIKHSIIRSLYDNSILIDTTFSYLPLALSEMRSYLKKEFDIDISEADVISIFMDFGVIHNQYYVEKTIYPRYQIDPKLSKLCKDSVLHIFHSIFAVHSKNLRHPEAQIAPVIKVANLTNPRMGLLNLDMGDFVVKSIFKETEVFDYETNYAYPFSLKGYLKLSMFRLLCKLIGRRYSIKIVNKFSSCPRSFQDCIIYYTILSKCRSILSMLKIARWNDVFTKAFCEPEKITARVNKHISSSSNNDAAIFNHVMIDLVKKSWKLAFGKEPKKVVTVPHHLAHAASAYYTSGFNRALAVTIDGSGEVASTTVWDVKDGEFELLYQFPTVGYSLGGFYETLSYLLGFDPDEGPGKVMGLAPYGEKTDKYWNLVTDILEVYDEGSDVPYALKYPVVNIPVIFSNYKVNWNPKAKPLNEEAANFAYAIQRRFEEAYLTLMRWAVRQTGVKEAVIAGGAALNAKANMEVLYAGIFNDVFVFPAANDAGTSIGAALWAYEHVLGGKVKNERIENVFWGADFSDEVDEAVKWAKETFNLKVERAEITELVDHLLRNEIVTVYQGRPEFGPRALGHRSIVADPRVKENWERVNALKGREWWRPLAPSLLLDKAKEYFQMGEHLPFMIVMERFKEGACERVPVVCHVDRTARPQTVTPSIDRNWYQLIKAFGDETGEYLVMNTSFNLGGEPLVDTPKQAIVSFLLGRFDAMWMDGYLIRRR